MPGKRFVLSVLFVLTAVVAGGMIARAMDARDYRRRCDSRAARLTKNVHEVNTSTLYGAIEQLAKQTGCPIEIDKRSMEAASIDADAPCFQRLFDVTLQDALDVLTENGVGATRLGWSWSNEKIIVSTLEDDVLLRSTTVRVYDLRTLDIYSGKLPLFEDPPTFNVTAAPTQNGSGGLFGSFNAPPDRPDDSTLDREEAVVKLIEETVAADTWRDAGGTVGSIRIDSGLLVIEQTPAAHEKIAALLEQFRKED